MRIQLHVYSLHTELLALRASREDPGTSRKYKLYCALNF